MADQEDEELKIALRLSMQHESPEPKRSKPGEDASVAGTGGGGAEGESPEARNRRMQRELMAAAAEKRMLAAKKAAAAAAPVAAAEKSVKEEKSGGPACTSSTESKDEKVNSAKSEGKSVNWGRELSAAEAKKVHLVKSEGKSVNSGRELLEAEAHLLFLMIFGNEVTKDILAQWSNQGIRFLGLCIPFHFRHLPLDLIWSLKEDRVSTHLGELRKMSVFPFMFNLSAEDLQKQKSDFLYHLNNVMNSFEGK